MDAIAKLNEMPLLYHLYEKEPWDSKGLRLLPIDNYLAFYKIKYSSPLAKE
jgi:toxin ParE1/3/4